MKFIIMICMICALSPTVFSEVLYENKMRYKKYDYIIIGGGASGSVIANRLSENHRDKIMMLEAGAIPPNISETPLLNYEMTGTAVDWNYQTVPQKDACRAFPNQVSPIARGKVLGGSSITNCMIYVRGNRRDYDEWAELGAKGWSFDEVLYYFLKSEDQTNQTLLEDGHHSAGGPLTVSSNSYHTPIGDMVIEAAAESGYDIVDYNGGSQIGIGNVQATVRNGARCSTEKAYLRPAAKRKNLDILYNAFVTKINIKNRVARSVSFDFKGTRRTVFASKEIILSAGAIGSPQILMLSGIGPEQHLKELKIPVVANLPVGENFQDHPRDQGLPYYFNQSVSIVLSRDVNNETREEFKEGKGPLTVPCGVQSLGFIRTKYQNGTDPRPDIEFSLISPAVNPDPQENQLDSEKDIFAIYPSVLTVKSRGVIRLNSSNPYVYPLIDPRFLSHEEDVLRFVEGHKLAKSLMKAPVIQELQPELREIRVPGCDTPDMDSDEYLQCAVRGYTHTAAHSCCACKMGDRKDPTTVVDPLLRVKGVRHLRVADSSIMPIIPSGNTNAPSIMIGEKAADILRGRRWDPKKGKLVRI